MIPGLGEAAERLRRGTVYVTTEGNGRGGGSGVIAASDGEIVTNAHVARGGAASVTLWDGRKLPAKVAARDVRRDLARLSVAGDSLPAVEFGDSSSLRPGELVMAIGNPLGFIGALSTGVVHAVGALPGLGGRLWVQADVRLAPGNSGGPLADAHGRVIGINTMIAGGLALAIPSAVVREFLRTGVGGPFLGVEVRPLSLRGATARFGLMVLRIEPGSPAAGASLLPGDVLVGADGRRFGGIDDLSRAIESARGPLRLEFLRGDRGQSREVAVRMGSRSEAA